MSHFNLHSDIWLTLWENKHGTYCVYCLPRLTKCPMWVPVLKMMCCEPKVDHWITWACYILNISSSTFFIINNSSPLLYTLSDLCQFFFCMCNFACVLHEGNTNISSLLWGCHLMLFLRCCILLQIHYRLRHWHQLILRIGKAGAIVLMKVCMWICTC